VKLGFTGTREGMSTAQHSALVKVLGILKPAQVHHGACRGADDRFHGLVYSAVLARVLSCKIYAHPSNLPKLTASCMGADVRCEPKPPLVRNKDIVHAVDVLLAAPLTDLEILRSGTWSTVRYARKLGKPVCVLGRDSFEPDLTAIKAKYPSLP